MEETGKKCGWIAFVRLANLLQGFLEPHAAITAPKAVATSLKRSSGQHAFDNATPNALRFLPHHVDSRPEVAHLVHEVI